jgi:uncharacterized protein
VTAGERIVPLDLLRGFAVLGILLINVWAYALPYPASLNPHLVGFNSLADQVIYALVFLLAYTKTMPIFAMLFGAGVALFAQRQESRGTHPRRPFLKRQFWLLIFGLAHAYLIWNGDILVPYAFCGVIVFLLRNRSRRLLVILIVGSLLIPKLGAQAGGFFLEKMETEALASQEATAAGRDLTPSQMRARDQWDEMGSAWLPTADDLAENRAIMTGNHLAMINHFARETLGMHLFMYPLFIGWNLGAYMLIGVLLFRAGIITGARSPAFYRRMAWWCYGIGYPLSLGALLYFYNNFNFLAMVRVGFPWMDISGPLVALGHIALICLAYHRGWWPRLQARLVAAGRMAFTNYLSQTLLCGLLFFGFGLGWFGTFNRPALLGVTLGIWTLQLWWSPWWLARFRMGPLEWVWRRLTYGKTG